MIVALCVPLLVLGPLLGRGYVLTYDMVFSPHIHLGLQSIQDGRSTYNAIPIFLIIKLASLLLPVDIVQKIILYAIFFMSIYSVYRTLPIRTRSARLVAGLFYGLNPYVYDRLMAGHWLLLLAYSLTPWALDAFFRLFTNPNKRSLFVAALLWALLATISLHHLIIVGLLFLGMAVTFIRSRRAVYFALLNLITTALLLSWWIIPLLVSRNFTRQFGLADFSVFATKPDLTYGLWLNIISLQGFWYTPWHSVKEFGSYWPILVGLWLAPVCLGLGVTIGKVSAFHARLLWALGGVGLVAMLLAMGPNGETYSLNTLLFLHVPGLTGMREPQKLLALLALFYATCVAYGIDALGNLHKLWLQRITIGLSVTMIVAMSFYIYWGAHNQLALSNYPATWETFASYLDKQPAQIQVLVLPYELYLNKTFARRLIANPANVFYGDRVLTSNDPKLSGVGFFTVVKYQKLSEAIILHDPIKLRRELIRLHAPYIMLIQTDDIDEYAWVRQIPHTTIIRSEELMVFYLTGY